METMHRKGFTIIELLVVISIIAILGAIIANILGHGGNYFAGPMGNEEAKQSVKNCCQVQGFTGVKILSGETAWNSEDDTYVYQVSAVNPLDKNVSFKVYWSQYRGSTIRTD